MSLSNELIGQVFADNKSGDTKIRSSNVGNNDIISQSNGDNVAISEKDANKANTNIQQHSQEFSWMSLAPMGLIILLFWFLILRPQKKKMQQHNKMISDLKHGDQVITNSGIHGKIVKVGEGFFELEISNNAVIKIQKNAISNKE